MKVQTLNRITILLLVMILAFWTFLPCTTYAGSFISPGKPITPGTAIKGGKPITGGKFIVPGKVYTPGKAITPGKTGLSSGQVIWPPLPDQNGVFIIPNAPITVPSINFSMPSIKTGNPITPGTSMGSGTGPGGNAGAPGQVGGENAGMPGQVGGGNAGIPGQGSGGNAGMPGQGSGGNAGMPGQGSGGNAGMPGQGSGGNAGMPGQGSGGNAGMPGQGSGGNAGMPGQGSSGNAGTPGQGSGVNGGNQTSPSFWNSVFKSTNGEKGMYGHITGFASDFKTYGLKILLDKNVMGAAAAQYAGFKFEIIEGSTNYKVFGKENIKNKWANKLYQQYKEYKMNGSDKVLGPKSRRISSERVNAYLESKKLKPDGMSRWTYIKQKAVTTLQESHNPVNKTYWKLSNGLKMNGPVNFALTTAGTWYDYGSSKGKYHSKGLASTDFAGAISADVTIGAATAVTGSIFSSVLSGAVAGSAVPGLGTLIGAGTGLLVGIGSSIYFSTAGGKRKKQALARGFKKLYDGIGSKLKKGRRRLGELFG